MPQNAIVTNIVTIQTALKSLAATYRYGRIVREGFSLAIVGRPNAGKSSLFNRLLERERAIVTAQPGTTRDPISERVSLGGVPVEMIDTAGLRDAPSGPEGEAETQGILRSRATMADADFVVLVVDSTASVHEEDTRTLASLAGRPHRLVLNKCDLPPSPAICNRFGPNAIFTSAKTGEGLDALKAALLTTLTETTPASDSALITNLRQHEALDQALTALTAAHAAALASLPHEMLLLDLHSALDALDRLTGQTTADDILALIFSTFCIGK
jgi:tRNA modification GTPase